jgi:hypothetical protein
LLTGLYKSDYKYRLPKKDEVILYPHPLVFKVESYNKIAPLVFAHIRKDSFYKLFD